MIPKVSAYAHLNGPRDYNKHLLVLLGSVVHMHEKPDNKEHGQPIQSMVGTWVPPWSITERSKFERNLLGPKSFPTPCSANTNI